MLSKLAEEASFGKNSVYFSRRSLCSLPISLISPLLKLFSMIFLKFSSILISMGLFSDF